MDADTLTIAYLAVVVVAYIVGNVAFVYGVHIGTEDTVNAVRRANGQPEQPRKRFFRFSRGE